ncbi:MAG: sulfur carrier protein ThiS [Oscillospiraceae bacterium]|nr:sulfur carrier protein ThiS [Oscillospiraceae bacterium]
MVTINGEQKDCAGMTVAELLQSMKLDPARTAVMIGGDIVPKADYGRALAEGDEADIIGFVGGG